MHLRPQATGGGYDDSYFMQSAHIFETRDPANVDLFLNLGNLWRRLVLPLRVGHWSLTSLQQRLVKTGDRLIKHARHYWLLLAENHLTRRLFGSMAGRIASLPLPAG